VIDRLNLDTKLDSYFKEAQAPGSVRKTSPARAGATELVKKTPSASTAAKSTHARTKPAAEDKSAPVAKSGSKKGIFSKVFGGKK